jgi:hypothetical protein
MVLTILHYLKLWSARFAVRTEAARKAIVGIIYLPDWLKLALAGWVVVSLFSLPLVGRFLAGALRERADELWRSAAPQIRRGRSQSLASGGVPVPSGRP